MSTNERATAILHYLEAHKEEMLDWLAALVRTESPSRQPERQEAILSLIRERLEELNFQVFLMPGHRTGGYLVARSRRRRRHQPLQLLIGHCDTVWGVGTIDEMPLEREDNKMRGPGVYDMKAGLTQIIFALQAIQALELPLPATPVILVNSDEEIGSVESTPAIERLARIAVRAFVLEPPLGLEGRLKTARKGIGRFELVIRGRAAHAGLDPEKGASAIVELSHQIQQLFAMNDPARGISVNVGMVQGGISTNVIAPESRAAVDVRVLNMEDAEEIKDRIYGLRPHNPDTTIVVSGSFGRPPLERTPRNRRLWRLALAAASQLQLPLSEGVAGGGSDGNTTSLYTATLDGLGAPGDGAHATHEFIFADQLVERTALLALLLLAEE